MAGIAEGTVELPQVFGVRGPDRPNPDGPAIAEPDGPRDRTAKGSGGDRRSRFVPGGCAHAGIGSGFVALAGHAATTSSNTSVAKVAIAATVRPMAAWKAYMATCDQP